MIPSETSTVPPNTWSAPAVDPSPSVSVNASPTSSNTTVSTSAPVQATPDKTVVENASDGGNGVK
eukprot:CAMPEP_0194375106 /NCGR_PEP_ID=MMETSP0174-20130528/23572_1 /TAXON_ID=216777 /ORGANISM="Proboscia alata, Strain PI-D3" /LENGTH=64 /DNA_ID=CAMNT_0039155083 /DNA_START=9 /DNA_END=200 /DNA_ORIENTATION=-